MKKNLPKKFNIIVINIKIKKKAIEGISCL